MQVSANLTNETPAVLPSLANYTLISAFNISVSTATNVSTEVTSPYPCSINPSPINPFELVNGSWMAITPFSVNAIACTVSFAVPYDPIVGVFQKTAPTTTTVNTTTTIPSSSPPGHHTPPIAPIIAMIIAIIIVAATVAYYSRKGRHRQH